MAKSHSRRTDAESGFSLVETIVATGILAGALVAAAQLVLISVNSNHAARKSTYAATLAQQKMEQLRSLTWGFDELGLPLSDFSTNTAVVPAVNNGMGLTPSPDDALTDNVDGYVDYIDRFGRSLGGGPLVPDGTDYIRRWSVEPLPTNPNNTLSLQVVVFAAGGRPANANIGVRDRGRDEARIVSVKTRKSR